MSFVEPLRKKAKKLWTADCFWETWKERNHVVFEDMAYS